MLKKVLVGLGFLLCLNACSTLNPPMSASDNHRPPIVLVHGNGDNASIWQNIAWQFESNGWPRNRIVAIDFLFPLARADEAKEQPGRSGTNDQLRELAATIDSVLKRTGATQVILIANSRGGYAVRNYVRNYPGGKEKVASVVLGGVPNHGVWNGSFNPISEFNGAGAFLKALNAPQGLDLTKGLEVTPGVPFATLRSDNNDKFAQPKGLWIGQPNLDTGVTYDGPSLVGATNIVLPGRDHREVSFHPQAFAATYQFITGKLPLISGISIESAVVLNGRIGGFIGLDPVNEGLAGARVTVFEVHSHSGERKGNAVHEKQVAADGLWGPFNARSDTHYEFVIEAAGFATTHIYRSPFPRSSNMINLRPARIVDADKDAYSVVVMNRSRGYFGLGRDQMSFDGLPLPLVAPGVAGVSASKLKVMAGTSRPVVTEFNGERIVVRAWPLAENRLVFADLSY